MFVVLYLILSFRSKKYTDTFINTFSKQYAHQLISSNAASFSTEMLKRPVIITAHGFGASPFEWQDFSKFISTHSDALISNVFLGGHDSLSNFSSTSWETWLDPICNEYDRLVSLGFESIYICGCSVGSTLIIQGLLNHRFRPSLPLKHIFLIDTLIVPKQKLLYWLPWIKSFMFDPKLVLNSEEKLHWLPYRPKTSLLELLRLIKKTRRDINQGIHLPDHVQISFFQSTHDPVIDIKSYYLVKKALSYNLSKQVHSYLINSELHVFSRLSLRKNLQPQDTSNQTFFFNYVLGNLPQTALSTKNIS